MHTLSKRDRMFIGVVLLVIFFVGVIYTYAKPNRTEDPTTSLPKQPSQQQSASQNRDQQDKPTLIQVDVKGAVNHPGVYALPAQSRVTDAIRAAGGLTGTADPDSINLATILLDGSEVVIPSKNTASAAQHAAESDPHDGKINLNTATVSELDSLPGIGPTRAEQIVQYRETHGLFQSVRDLLNIEGFGPKLLEKIQDRVTVR
jgi:competence protein ComEA